VSEAEINPLLVKRDGEGVVGVDGLVVLNSNQQPVVSTEASRSEA
jgi:succinyl-CoA synthetase beta subunit